MPPGVQRYQRTRMVLPLRVWPGNETDHSAAAQLAHTLDISPIGDGWADYTIRYRPVRPSRYSGGKTDLSSG